MNTFTIFCTEAQTRRALELGAPINIRCSYNGYYPLPFIREIIVEPHHFAEVPTAEQMLGWLKTKGFAFGITNYNDGFNDHVFWRVANNQDKRWYISDDKLKDPKEAVLAAIDAALNYLKNKKGGNNEKSIV